MAIYKFKVSLEDNEDIYRDIEIKASQSFKKFHDAIQTAFKFDAKHSASFFISDDYWRKGQEITLLKKDLPLDDEEIRKKVEKKKLMSEIMIAQFIEQPHQRFIYIFDPTVQWSFLIEMLRILDETPKIKYPFISKSIGTSPKQYKQVNMANEELNADMAMANLIDEPELHDDEIYKIIDTEEQFVEDEDIKSLEGEEGEANEFENTNDEFDENDSDKEEN